MTMERTPGGSYGARVPRGKLLRKLMESMARVQIAMYRRSGGARMSRMMGFPVVLLTTMGARSGKPRTTPIGGFADGEDAWLVVASLAGAAHHPAWFINMVQNPDDIWLEVGKRRIKVKAESLLGADRQAAMGRVVAIAARYGDYQEKTDREIPVVRLTPAA